jgi:hypothetical protein
MAITTLDGAIAGAQVPFFFTKTGITMASVSTVRWHSHFYSAGRVAGTAPSSGVNGGAHTAPLAGTLAVPSTVGGQNIHLLRLSTRANQANTTLLVCDRLWSNSGLSTTLTTAQSISPAALPARSNDGTANGDGVLAAIEWSATGGAGTPNATISYTNQSGTAGRSGVVASVATPPVGTFELLPLQAGDSGVRSIQSFTWSATHTSGTFHLVLLRPICSLFISGANGQDAVDALTSGFPRLFDGTCPFIVQIPSATTATTISGEWITTQG